MMRLLGHLRSNGVAYVALFVALGGTSYAAFSLPHGSVGTVQLRNGAVTAKKVANGSITPIKLDHKLIGGSVLHWATVAANGKVEASSSKAHVIGAPEDGGYVVSWSGNFSGHCAAIATPVAASPLLGPPSGFANARIAGARPTSVWVDIYNAQGQPKASEFSVAVIC